MTKVMARIGIGAILLGSGLALGASANPAGAATIRPATATNCSWVGTLINRKGEDPHYYGFRATCTDTPTGQWRLDLVCTQLRRHIGARVRQHSYRIWIQRCFMPGPEL
jgi:hypothetical protein